MTSRLPVLALLGIALAFARPAPAQTAVQSTPDHITLGPADTTVIGEGMAVLGSDPAAAEDEAIWEAKRNAVEQAAGLFLHARTLGGNASIFSDEIHSRTDGFIRHWEIVADSKRIETVGNGRILRLEVRAQVGLLAVVRKLKDIADVYADLERPRVRLDLPADGPARTLRNRLLSDLKREGFDVVNGGSAEVVIEADARTSSVLNKGDDGSPYDVGQVVSAYRATVTLTATSVASDEVILAASQDARGQSFQGDADAERKATDRAARSLLDANEAPFLQSLLARWVHERADGHTVALTVHGITERQANLLKEELTTMRGFRDMLEMTPSEGSTTFRFVTRLDTAAIRRRIADLHFGHEVLLVQDQRGPSIHARLTAASTAAHSR